MNEYLYLGAAIAAALILLVFVSRKASRAAAKRRAIMNAQIEELKKENRLREKYKVLTRELLEAAEMPELLEGMTSNIQTRLENAEDMRKAFETLPLSEQYIYALNYFIADSRESLSEFFKKNGEPLISLAPEALDEIGSGLGDTVREMLAMYDESNEEVSYDRALVEKINAEFAEALNPDKVYNQIKKYILSQEFS